MSYKIDFTTFHFSNNNLITTVTNGNITSGAFKSAYNNNGSLGKVYGTIDFSKSAAQQTIIVSLSDTGLRPSSQITINSAGILAVYNTNYVTVNVSGVALTINTDGTATISFSAGANILGGQIVLSPVLIFAQDFGD